jgi:sulfate adenylyltransferase
MASALLPEPHGGSLVNLLVDEDRSVLLKEIALNLPDITLNDRQLCDLEMLATGAFSPLEGFMGRSDYESVLDRMQLQNGVFWPLPVCLGIPDIQARTLEAGQSITLRDPEGFLLAVMHIEDICRWIIRRRLYGFTVPLIALIKVYAICLTIKVTITSAANWKC